MSLVFDAPLLERKRLLVFGAPIAAGAVLLAAGATAVWYNKASQANAVPDSSVSPTAQAQAPGTKPVTATPSDDTIPLQDLTPAQAAIANAAIPISTLPNPAAQAFKLVAADPADRAKAVQCLTQAVYYESANEPAAGQQAVAQVVLNRMRHPSFPKSVCGVVYQGSERQTGCQFTFTCDGSLARVPDESLWKRAQAVAEAALNGFVAKPVGTATHYHTQWVLPYWSPSLVKLTQVGAHIFYRWTGQAGQPPAFRGKYAGTEPTVNGAPTAPGAVEAAAAQVAAAEVAAAEAAVAASDKPAAKAEPVVVVAPVEKVEAVALAAPKTVATLSAPAELPVAAPKTLDTKERWIPKPSFRPF